MEIKMNELLELMRRVYDHGVKAREAESRRIELDSIKEIMIINFLCCIQDNDNCFCISPDIGNPFQDSV